MSEPAATAKLRSSFYDKTVKGVVERSYKFKNSLTIVTTSAWKNFFYREKSGVLTDPSSSNTPMGGIPRGAAFPQANVEWDRIETVITKFGMEDTIPWEDTLTDDIDVRNRTLIKIGERVAKQVDDSIWAALGGNITVLGTDTSGNAHAGQSKLTASFAIHKKREWSSSAIATILDDLMLAKQTIGELYYPTNNLQLWINERDHRSIVRYLSDKGAQFPDISVKVTNSGVISNLAGFNIIVSNSVTASNALVVVPKRCATWKQLVPIKTTSIEDPYINTKIRTVEEGVTQLTDPGCVVRIMGTDGRSANENLGV